MITFHYQVLRYQPDKVGEEFINVGVVVFAMDTCELLFRYQDSPQRLSAFFPSGNNMFIIGLLRTLAASLSASREQWGRKGLGELTASVLPGVDSALYFSEPRSGLDTDLETALGALYDRMVTRYEHATEPRTTV